VGSPGLDVVIVSYRSRDLLRACLASLREHPPDGPLDVHVVDNDSRDGTVKMVRERFPEVDLLPLEQNVGFGRASNAGAARGAHPYVLFLNPDTRLRAGALDGLLALMERQSEVGIAGCRLELEDGTVDHAGRRSFPTIVGALGHFTTLGRRRGAPAALSQYAGADVSPGPVDAVNGAFMLVRRTALDEVGGFDEGYWMYMEDLDLCWRFRERDRLTWYEPSVSVVHVKHGTTGRWRSPRLVYAFHYGMYRFYRSHYAPRRNVLVNVAVYAGICAKLVVSLMRTTAMRVAER
jgi:GT2 family glycosyltransferase